MLSLALLALTQLQDSRPDWPAWRGPDGTNVSAERGWSSAGAPEPLWKVQVGRGHSSVTIQRFLPFRADPGTCRARQESRGG